jgi:hypothetical protein
MAFHTWRRADGTFYDSSAPENEADEALPLRPSDVYDWSNGRWVWHGQRMNHSVPRQRDSTESSLSHKHQDIDGVTFADLRDMMCVLNEQLETQQYQARALGELRQTVTEVMQSMQDHLEEARPLMDTLAGLQAISKAAGAITTAMAGVGMVLRGIWKFSIVVLALYAMTWALFVGDAAALRRAIALMLSPTGAP